MKSLIKISSTRLIQFKIFIYLDENQTCDLKITYSFDKINPFGGLFFVDKLLFNFGVYKLIDNELGSRSDKATYSYTNTK